MLIFNLDKLKNGNAFVPCHFFKSDSVSKSEAAEMLIFLSFRRGWKQAQLGGIIALIFHNEQKKIKLHLQFYIQGVPTSFGQIFFEENQNFAKLEFLKYFVKLKGHLHFVARM